MKIELGAGERPAPGFVAVDVNPRSAHVIADALHVPFRTGTVTALRAVDVLEHITYRQTDLALAEWARVCAPDAAVYVQVPDADTIMRWYVNGDDRLRQVASPMLASHLHGAEWRLLGGHGDGRYVQENEDFRWNAHYSLWSKGTLLRALSVAGFDVTTCHTNGHPNLLCHARRREYG